MFVPGYIFRLTFKSVLNYSKPAFCNDCVAICGVQPWPGTASTWLLDGSCVGWETTLLRALISWTISTNHKSLSSHQAWQLYHPTFSYKTNNSWKVSERKAFRNCGSRCATAKCCWAGQYVAQCSLQNHARVFRKILTIYNEHVKIRMSTYILTAINTILWLYLFDLGFLRFT